MRSGTRSALAAGLLGLAIIASIPMRLPTEAPIQVSAVAIDEKVGPTQAIAVKFSSPMDWPSVTAAMEITPASPVQVAWQSDQSTMQISPDREWRLGQRYVITFSEDARSATGHAIGRPLRVSFVTMASIVAGNPALPTPPAESGPSSTASPLPTPVAPPAVGSTGANPGQSQTPTSSAKAEPDPGSGPAAPAPGVVGYGAGTTGGAGGRVYSVSTWAELSAAVQASGPRIVRVVGDQNLDGAGERLSIGNGNLTIDGSAWTGAMKRYNLILRASNIIITQMRMRPGDAVDDLRVGGALILNPAEGETLSGIVLDHSDFLWAVDATVNVFNQVSNVTIQHCIIGGGLLKSAGDAQNGYGFSTHGDQELHRGITLYRNFITTNRNRNLRAHSVAGIDFVNNVVYNWGDKAADGNPVGANYVGNMFKKGPETQASDELWHSETFGYYSQWFQNAVYWDDNLGLGFTPTNSFAPGVRRTTPYGGQLHNVIAAPASATLAAQVVSAAGPALVDGIDASLKTNFANRTGGFYYGAGYGSPTPSW